jgi:hypothetical protein
MLDAFDTLDTIDAFDTIDTLVNILDILVRGGFGYFVDCYFAQILVVECRLKRQNCCRL